MILNDNKTCFYHRTMYANGTMGFVETDGGCSFMEEDGKWIVNDCNYEEYLTFDSLQEVVEYLKSEHPQYEHVILL